MNDDAPAVGQPMHLRLTSAAVLASMVSLSFGCERSSKPATPAPSSDAIPSHANAIVIDTWGAQPSLRQVPVARPGAHEVLVAVHAASVNPVDAAVQAGDMRELTKPAMPLTPGYDISGVVAAVGSQVTAFKPGDAVHGYLSLDRGGAYAEYALALDSELAPKPARLSHVEAAALPLTALTAWQALEHGGVSTGSRVLIHGGAGGVGTMAVQLAAARGAEVIATASAANVEYVKQLGATGAIDYRAQKFEDDVKDVDFVLDPIGGETQKRSWKIVKRGGMLVSLVDPPPADVDGVRGAWFLVKPSGQQLAAIDALVDAGRVKPVVTTVLPLAEAARAQELLRTTHSRGKIVLEVRPSAA